MSRERRSLCAVTLLEALVAVGMFALVTALVMGALVKSMDGWRRSSSQHSAEQSLYKARSALTRDLQSASVEPEHLAVSPGPSSLGVPDGDAVWFLSAIDPATGQAVINDGTDSNDMGTLRWQRNILYYSVVPQNHATHFGFSCTGNAGPTGSDDHCPHKILIRLVLNGPDDPDGVELLLPPADIAAYLTAPDNYDTSPISGPYLEEVKIVADSLVTFDVELADPEIQIDLRAVSLSELQKTDSVGNVPLSRHPKTTQRLFAIFPNN
jgi:type II secretory pathway pseudopilin PulG